ncbi:hypothetical protein HN51_019918 [Arachis hypogaea]|uniref:E3 ubiquitin-protein ligase RING1-like n=1 Tax=Arachis duranensis TaxID=130453 RepID=A0A6P4BX25_ARADU|nr:E3 ubiquitin-protein ligase RING1-like [Arachis duranensis]
MVWYLFTIDIQTILIALGIVILFFFIFYQILYGLFFWYLELSPEELRDIEEAIHRSYGDTPNHHIILLETLIQRDIQNSLAMVDDKECGPKLRASNKLPPLVRYGMHDTTNSHCDECAICMEDFEDGQYCQVFPKCKHMYHSNCIDTWLQKNPTCPICRSCIV